MNPKAKQDIRNALRTIAENHAATMAVLERTLQDLAAELNDDQPASSRTVKRDAGAPYVDLSLLSVVHRGKCCFLGDTFPFRLMAKLIGSPNRYFSYDELLADVWDCVRSRTAVRSVVKILRAKLRDARLDELAAAIDGSVKQHYGLILNRTLR